MDNCRLPLTIGPSGECRLAGQLLHPALDPLPAACADMAGLLNPADPADTLVLAGVGLGWHLKAALSAWQPQQLIVYQLGEADKAWADCLGPDLPPLTWVRGSQEMAEALGRRLVYAKEAGRLALYIPPAYRACFPRLETEIRALLADGLSRGRSDRLTRSRLGGLWSRNTAANAGQIFSRPDIIHSALAFKDIPALVLGAGPSLDLSLPHLAQAGHALILGAASILGPLQAQGLAPHLVVALEGMDESRQFAGGDEHTCLLAALNSHPQHFSAWPQERKSAFFQVSSWLPRLLDWGGELPSGGHATSAAFSLACLWGCNPIILVGQDLAYTRGQHTHASARPGRDDEAHRPELRLPALDGGMVETSWIMHSYLQWYQEAAAHLRRHYPQVKIFNASAAGAVIPGFQAASLPQLLADLPARKQPRRRVAELLASLPLAGREKLGPRIKAAHRLLAASFPSYEALAAGLGGSALQTWLQEEVRPPSWRSDLAHARLILEALRKEV
jgi:hypothetical protein